jgi:pilus assembly protein Flp/PilA
LQQRWAAQQQPANTPWLQVDITPAMGDVLHETKCPFKPVEVIMNKQLFKQFGKSIMEKHDAVTSIEYALIGSLIAVVIVGAVGLVGTRTLVMWNLVSNCVIFATTGSGSCA